MICLFAIIPGGSAAGSNKRKRDELDTQLSAQADPYQELRQRRASIIAGIAEGYQHYLYKR